jgi:hypothetical protein
MRSIVFFRMAAGVLLIFAALHTVGFLGFVPPTVQGIAVRDAMDSVHFTLKGATYSYGNFYRGFGLFVTAALVFEAFVAWTLGTMVRNAARHAVSIGSALASVQIAGAIIAWRYFGVPQVSFCLLLVLLLSLATLLAQREGAAV